MELDGDPYDIGIDKRFRPLVKEIFNRLINGKRIPFPYRYSSSGIIFDEADIGLSWDEFLGLTKDRLKAVSDQFSSGTGLKLQRLDSDLVPAVMLEANTLNVPMPPIHDRVIIRLTDYPDLMIDMERSLIERASIKVRIKITEPQTSDLTARLSKHWEQFDLYDPTKDDQPEPQLTNQFVSGYESYQKRVGEMIQRKHKQIFR